jgi:alpha/beta superfamily hydrolase
LGKFKNSTQPRYSAGSAIACGCVDEMEEIKGYCAIGYPYGWWSSWMFGSHYPKAKSKKPKLFLLGDCDQFTSESSLDSYMSDLEGEKKKVIIPGADHFFFDYEEHLDKNVENWLREFHKK